MERTLLLIKPDGVSRNLSGEILRRYAEAGLRIRAMKLLQLSAAQAKEFYAVHRERPFYESLSAYMASGPIVAVVLEGESAIQRHRALMGATNPEQAETGTIRRDFGESIEQNTVHGSDAPQTAREEIAFFFSGLELHAS